ncbi:unnamed protein product [Effrenium voratum]|nr:unnamed protein product [Effrenium voratum]
MQFVQGMSALRKLGCDAFLEVGPQPVLVKMGRRCVAEEGGTNLEKLQWLASLQPGRDEVESMLIASRALGVAFERCSELQPISLPWRSPLLHPLLGRQLEEGLFEASEAATAEGGQQMQLFEQHQVFERVVLPGASHLLLAAAAHLAAGGAAGASGGPSAVELSDAIFELPFVVEAPLKVRCRVSAERTEVLSSAEGAEAVHARCGAGRVVPSEPARDRLAAWRKICAEGKAVESVEGLYSAFQEKGLSYGDSFQTLTSDTVFCAEGALARLRDPCRSSWENPCSCSTLPCWTAPCSSSCAAPPGPRAAPSCHSPCAARSLPASAPPASSGPVFRCRSALSRPWWLTWRSSTPRASLRHALRAPVAARRRICRTKMPRMTTCMTCNGKM